MEDSLVMAVLDGIQDLEEDALGKLIISDILVALSDAEEEVSFRAVLQNHVDAVDVLNNLEHGNHILMC